MTDCKVWCPECERDWWWLCEECAVMCQDDHRRQTGHATELTVVVG